MVIIVCKVGQDCHTLLDAMKYFLFANPRILLLPSLKKKKISPQSRKIGGFRALESGSLERKFAVR